MREVKRSPDTTAAPRRRPVLPVLALLCAIGAGTACGGDGDPVLFPDDDVRTVVREAFSGIDGPRQAVVRDPNTWESLLEEIYGRTWPRASGKVDFTRHMLIAVALGTRPTGGFHVEFEDVVFGEDAVHVFAVEVSPGVGCEVLGAVTRPVHVVRVVASDLPVVFTVREEVRDCV